MACAIACDDSSAGRMPSSRASVWNASSASSSSTYAYSARPRVAQPGVLGADGRVVEAGRHRMRQLDVAVLVLQHERARALQDAGAAAGEPRRVLARRDAARRRLRRRSAARRDRR